MSSILRNPLPPFPVLKQKKWGFKNKTNIFIVDYSSVKCDETTVWQILMQFRHS